MLFNLGTQNTSHLYHQVLQRSRDAILALELLTKLSEGVDVNNMMDGDFDFKQFQV